MAARKQMGRWVLFSSSARRSTRVRVSAPEEVVERVGVINQAEGVVGVIKEKAQKKEQLQEKKEKKVLRPIGWSVKRRKRASFLQQAHIPDDVPASSSPPSPMRTTLDG